MNIALAQPAEVGTRRADTSRGTHSNILNRQWISRPADQRFLSLSALRDAVHFRAAASREQRLQTKAVELVAPVPKTVADTHDLWLALPDGSEIAPTHWSFSQLCTLAGAPSAYVRRKPSQLVADMLTDDLRFRREVEQIKFYHTGDQLLAATGPDYGRIYDFEVVDAVSQIAGNGNESRWKVPGVLDWRTGLYDPDAAVTKDSTTLYASDRDVWIMLVDDRNPIEIGRLKDGSPDLVSRGFIVTNSEVGSSSLKLMAFYFRAVCANRIIWGVENFQTVTMRHSKYAPSRFIEEIRPALNSFAEGSAKTLTEGVQRAKEAKVADDQDEALAFLMARDFSRKMAAEVLETAEREEGQPARTIWDMAQGITAMARSFAHTDERVAMELKAEALLARVA